MKKALAAVIAACLVGLMAVGVMAQVPNVQIYFDPNYTQTAMDCQPAGTNQDLFVVMNNFNAYVQAVDFSVDYPGYPGGPLFLAGEDAPPGSAVIGTSPSGGADMGIAVGFDLRRNGSLPVLALTVHTFWTAECDCGQGPYPIVVRGYQYQDLLYGKQQPQAIQWPDYVPIDGVGMTSLICPQGVGVEESTWGGVKALYR